MKLRVNQGERTVDAEPDTPLLWVLRDTLGLTGTKYGCGKAVCGACTVLLDGRPTRSCALPVSAVGDAEVTTIEGAVSPVHNAVRDAWLEIDVAQCGFCQSGQILAASALLASNPTPAEKEIDAAMDGNLCRCATYTRIRRAIRRAAATLA